MCASLPGRTGRNTQAAAAQEGSHVIIEVYDDGAGICVEKIRKKAVERGLITAQRAARQSERELLQLIFVARLFYRRGRDQRQRQGRGHGRGAHQCRKNWRQGGDRLARRQGTTLRMRIPLTLAIIPALIVRSLNQSFALPQGALSELVHIPPSRPPRPSSGSRMRRSTGCAASCCRWSFLTGC